MKDSGSRIKRREVAIGRVRKETATSASGKKTKHMGLEYASGETGIDTRAILLTV